MRSCPMSSHGRHLRRTSPTPPVAHAACRSPDVDPAWFFPGPGDHCVQLAKKVCAGCAHQVECADYATGHADLVGVWGGLSGTERRSIRRGHDGVVTQTDELEAAPVTANGSTPSSTIGFSRQAPGRKPKAKRSTCAHCGDSLTRGQKRYCSVSCRNLAEGRSAPPPGPDPDPAPDVPPAALGDAALLELLTAFAAMPGATVAAVDLVIDGEPWRLTRKDDATRSPTH